MGCIEGYVKCIYCKTSFEVKIVVENDYSSYDELFDEIEKDFNSRNWEIVNAEDESNVNIICNDCLELVMGDPVGEA